MNTTTMKNTVIEIIKKAIIKFNKDYKNKTAIIPEVRFTKRGKTAGCVTYKGLQDPYINFNMVLLKENFDDFVSQTVPHEVAHYLTWVLYGLQYTNKGRRIIHGKDWKNMMSYLGVESSRCHSYNTANSTVRKMKVFEYKCDCMTHELTSIRHNKVLRGKAKYCCSKCGSKLVRV